jgi:hypothetical protein
MARPKKHETTMRVVSLRLPQAIIDEIDRYASKLHAETPMFKVTTADAIRYLIMLGLQASSAKGGKKK